MFEKYFFDLPIYRCNADQHNNETKKASLKIKRWIKDNGGITEEQAPRVYELAVQRVFDDYEPWQFNQIIGWLRLYVCGSHIGAHLWWVSKGRRIRYKMKHKKFGLVTPSNILATYFSPSDTSDEIYQQVMECLRDIASKPPLKTRHIDLSLLERIGPYVNWRDLLVERKKT